MKEIWFGGEGGVDDIMREWRNGVIRRRTESNFTFRFRPSSTRISTIDRLIEIGNHLKSESQAVPDVIHKNHAFVGIDL